MEKGLITFTETYTCKLTFLYCKNWMLYFSKFKNNSDIKNYILLFNLKVVSSLYVIFNAKYPHKWEYFARLNVCLVSF